MKTWAKGLFAALIGGTVSTLSAAYAVPDAIRFDHNGAIAMVKIAAAGALLNALAYLKQSPLPCDVDIVKK